MKTKSIFHLITLLVIITFVSSCKKDNDDDNKETSCTPVKFSGIWEGNWESSTNNLSGTFKAIIIQDSNKLSGTINIPDVYIYNAPLKGEICGNEISFGDIDETITFSGTVENDSTASGQYKYPSYRDKGSWDAQKLDEVPEPSEFIETNFEYYFVQDIASDGSYFYFPNNFYNTVYQVNNTGTITDSMQTPYGYSSAIAIDGSDIILGGNAYENKELYRCKWGEEMTITLPSSSYIRGLTHDGENLLMLDGLNDRIFKINTYGKVLNFFYISDHYDNEYITFDGANLWFYSSYYNRVVQIDTTGDLLQELEYPFTSIDGIAYFDGYLYFLDKTEGMIYKTDLKMHLLDSIDTPTDYPDAITFEGANLWVVESDNSIDEPRAFQMKTDGTILKEIDFPHNWSNIVGMACYNNILWCGYENDNFLYKYNTDGSTYVRINDLHAIEQLEWDGNYFWNLEPGQQSITKFDKYGNILFNTYLALDNIIGSAFDGSNIWILTSSYYSLDYNLHKLDEDGDIIESIALDPPITEDKSIFQPLAITYHNGDFYIMGLKVGETQIIIYKCG